MSRSFGALASKNAAKVQNRAFDTFSAVRGGVEPRHQRVFVSPAKYVARLFNGDARILQSGAYGTAFELTLTEFSRDVLDTLLKRDLSYTLSLGLPPSKDGAKVLLKVAGRKKRSSKRAFIIENTREFAAHVHLCEHPPVTVGGRDRGAGCRTVLHAARYVPQFYAAGIDTEFGMAVTVMAMISNAVSLKKLSPITPGVFKAVERAKAALLAAGVEHSDMHFDNILVQSGRVFIIDFGFAFKMSEATRLKFIRYFAAPGSALSLNAVARALLQREADAVQYKRYDGDLTFYNPTHKAYAVLWSRLTPRARKTLRDTMGSRSLACAWKQ